MCDEPSYPLSVASSDRVEEASDPQNAARSPTPSGGSQRTARRSLVTWIDLAVVLSVAFLATIVYVDFADPGVTESSDYVSSFYVAGRLAASREFDRLYPEPDAVSFRDTAFNDSAHQLLLRLPERTTTNFMYPPIVAWVFAPLSVLPPHVSLLAWQAISVSALGLSCLLLSRTTDVRARDLFLLSSLFFPTFMAVLVGQSGILSGWCH